MITAMQGFFLPILGILFTGPGNWHHLGSFYIIAVHTTGLIFILLTKNKTDRIWNVFMWLTLAIGNGWLMVLYAREYFARQIPDPALDGTWEDFFVPRTFRVQFPQYFNWLIVVKWCISFSKLTTSFLFEMFLLGLFLATIFHFTVDAFILISEYIFKVKYA
jgi:hypothetical protein